MIVQHSTRALLPKPGIVLLMSVRDTGWAMRPPTFLRRQVSRSSFRSVAAAATAFDRSGEPDNGEEIALGNPVRPVRRTCGSDLRPRGPLSRNNFV